MIPALTFVPRETLGTQIKLFFEKGDVHQQEARETSNEMSKQYMQELESAINNHRFVKGKFYIAAVTKKEHLFDNVMKTVFIVRKTDPWPEYGMTLYSFNNDTNELKLEWIIPSKEEVAYMLDHLGYGWDKKLIDDIANYKRFLDFKVQKLSQSSSMETKEEITKYWHELCRL